MADEVQQPEPGFAEDLYARGWNDLVSVAPPRAQLTPSSKIPAASLGKVPARRLANGLYAGYNWMAHEPTADDVGQWRRDGSNVGLRAARFPGLDVDCTDPRIAQIIEDAAVEKLGPAPIRVGRPPKRLLMYRTDEPFGRMRLWIERKGENDGEAETHLVEILGQGNQYVVDGTHPGTLRRYEWLTDPRAIPGGAAGLTPITREQANAFLDYLAELPELRDFGTLAREGDGRPVTRVAAADQTDLLAPSIEALREAVRVIPNTNELFPARSDYLKMGYAIRSASGVENEDEAFAIFAEWAGRWEGNDRFDSNDPEVVHQDWRRIKGPFAVGWSWIAGYARRFGFNDAALVFEVLTEAPAEEAVPEYIVDFNRRYAKVERVSNVVLHTPEGGGVVYMPAAHWRDIVANEKTVVAVKGDKTKLVATSQLWMQHPKRRTVVNIVVDPSKPPLQDVPSASQPGRNDFNAWPGLAKQPSPDGSCDLFLAHLRDVICSGDVAAYEWLVMWFAAMVQDPARLPGTAVALSGPQGSGKSVVGEVLGAMLGDALYTTVAGVEELTGRFNSQLEHKVLVQAEEAFYAGSRSIVGKLKTIVTAPTMRIERKGVEPYQVANLAHLLVTSNEDWPVRVEQGERRFTSLKVDGSRANDWAYFSALRRQMFDQGGCERLLHYLLHDIRVDWERISRPIANDTLRDQQMQSLDPDKRWLSELLHDGVIPGDLAGEGSVWTSDLYAHFQRFLKEHGWASRASPEVLGRLLTDYGVTKRQVRTGPTSKPNRYYFPSLAQMRAQFGRSFATAPEWDDTTGWRPDSHHGVL